jgi:outer membrane protein TolC
MDTRKSLRDQVREIQNLIEDAEETLDQARYALETLINRLEREEPAPAPDR